MPLQGYTVGRDVTYTVSGPDGPIRFSEITKFTSKQDKTEKKIKGLDGITRHLRFPDGWSGSMEIDRRDSTVDDYFAQLESNYYAGLNEDGGTITETITEADGSVSQYRYTGVLLSLDDAGSKGGDDNVKMKVSFVASRRIKAA